MSAARRGSGTSRKPLSAAPFADSRVVHTREPTKPNVRGREKNKHSSKRNPANIGGTGKARVFALIERYGMVRSRHVPNVNGRTLRHILVAQVDCKSFLMTDDNGVYRPLGREFARREAVNQSIEECVCGEAHTNTVEGYFSILKRGITGMYHHVSQQHLMPLPWRVRSPLHRACRARR